MNDRIQGLAVTADEYCDLHYAGSIDYDLKWEQKFAELIIRECSTLVQLSLVDANPISPKDILNHFGFE